MRLHGPRNGVVGAVLTLATLASLGPHLAMLGYKLSGTPPPAALLFVCPLHQLGAGHAPALVLHQPALKAAS